MSSKVADISHVLKRQAVEEKKINKNPSKENHTFFASVSRLQYKIIHFRRHSIISDLISRVSHKNITQILMKGGDRIYRLVMEKYKMSQFVIK